MSSLLNFYMISLLAAPLHNIYLPYQEMYPSHCSIILSVNFLLFIHILVDFSAMTLSFPVQAFLHLNILGF